MARKLVVEILGDASSLEKAFAKSQKSAKQFDKTIEKAGRSTKQQSKLFGGLGKAAGLLGASFGGAAVVGGIKSSIDAASDLNESMNAVNVVFGDASKTILKFSEDAAAKTGLSMRELNELVTPIGAALRNTGDSAEEAAEKSVTLTKRAADLASVFNTDVKDALGAIQAGLRGEADPLERFGIQVNDNAVTLKAMAMGLAETKKELTASDKAQARYALILEQSAKVQGDFERTSGGLANQQRILRATIEDLSAKLGAALLPTITKLVTALTKWLSNSKNQKQLLDTLNSVIGAVAVTVKILAEAFRVLTTVTGGTKNAVYLLIGAFAAFKALQIAGAIRGVLLATGALNTAFVGPAGLVAATGVLSFAFTTAILKATGLDGALKSVGGTAFDVAASLGLVNDQMKQFEGKTNLGQADFAFMRRQLTRLERAGMSPAQAAAEFARTHPGVARHDIDVTARDVGRTIVINGGVHLNGVQDVKGMEGELTKRGKARARVRRGAS